jgi:hypothetical protein
MPVCLIPSVCSAYLGVIMLRAAVLQIAFLGVKLAWHFAAKSLEGEHLGRTATT